MTSDVNRIEEVFLAAAEVTAAGRSAFLDEACGADAKLRAEVERLLAAHAEPAGIFKPFTVFSLSGPLIPHPGSPLSETGTTLAGRYKLLEKIDEGGMGEVWVARQSEPVKRTVAIKLIKPGMDSKMVLARFEAERQALALMDHANIARVLDGGLSPDGRPFFVMDLVKGVPITQFCDLRKLNLRQRLELFVQVCHAIQHAHQKGIIHRDIKPSNVLVALYDDTPVPKVTDFGVAKATGQSLSEQTLHAGFGQVVGTPQYMSPEQATFNNLDVDTRSDLYSLGVLLYELLAGSPPFAGKDLDGVGLLEILRAVREQEPPRPSIKLSTSDALPTLAANRGAEPRKLTRLLNELDWIVMKSLEKDRTRRYETANCFAADVMRYLSGETVQAVPPSAAYRLKKFALRNQAVILAGSVILLALLVGLAGSTYGIIEAENRSMTDVHRSDGERTRDSAPAYDGFGQVLLGFGDEETAIAALKKSISLDRKYATAQNNLGEALKKLDDRYAASSAFKKTITIDPKFIKAHVNLAQVHLDQKSYANAIVHAREAIKLDARIAQAFAILGMALLETGDIPGACESLTEAARLDPKRFSVLLSLLPQPILAPLPRVKLPSKE
jgi:serine/threonine protein kinase